jgi:hypothetical protein
MDTGLETGERFSQEQVGHMLDHYCHTLDDLGYEPVPFPDLDAHVTGSIYLGAKYDTLNHARWMCDEARAFARQGRWAKAHRWIGMIQGLLFVGGVYSISELKGHNRSP